ncbi:hypothetical protein BEWA_032970 [Theileria equi strain WA]|uniref:ABM domain-containing protein n=1 Tax=Theileria equi strain WA TaxID=1537102 RepID=L0AZZ9_THEEQ|nr:hypothetical protein BEWA_032970 [Theileria equi strain WA]AFZ80444.1 hypothetical protein BEWA_032970 [Theileria equi strain WA]|eukprot:XP_004830110.1 hypothetical protein BEWA_032970 [Theileria equi strain WA]
MLKVSTNVYGTILTRRFLNRMVTFSIGFAGTYAFTNPDLDRIWEVHPAFEQKSYAFVNFYQVAPEDSDHFEKNIKCLTRFLQTQEGYGYTRVLRLDKDAKGPLANYQYVGIQTWFNADLMKKALDSTISQKIIANLRLKNPYNSIMYKIMVDDSSFVPN